MYVETMNAAAVLLCFISKICVGDIETGALLYWVSGQTVFFFCQLWESFIVAWSGVAE